jgi:hypothetical protein
VDNPLLETEDECHEFAQYVAWQQRGQLNAKTLAMPYSPLYELEDRVHLDGEAFFVLKQDISARGGNRPLLETRMVVTLDTPDQEGAIWDDPDSSWDEEFWS